MENIFVYVVDNRIDKDFLYEIIYLIINEDDFSEEFCLKIIDVIN